MCVCVLIEPKDVLLHFSKETESGTTATPPLLRLGQRGKLNEENNRYFHSFIFQFFNVLPNLYSSPVNGALFLFYHFSIEMWFQKILLVLFFENNLYFMG